MEDGMDLSGLFPILLNALGGDNNASASAMNGEGEQSVSGLGGDGNASSSKSDGDWGSGDGGGFDPTMLGKLLGLVSALTADDEAVCLLKALRPLLAAERQNRVDGAITICRIASALPALKDTGLLDNLLGGL